MGDTTKYYAFKNIRNGKYISGTDFRTYPYKQILANEHRPPKLISTAHEIHVKAEIAHRHINPKTYKVVQVEIKEVK